MDPKCCFESAINSNLGGMVRHGISGFNLKTKNIQMSVQFFYFHFSTVSHRLP